MARSLASSGLKSRAFGDISGTYAKITGTDFDPSRLVELWIKNEGNAVLTLSFDGTTDEYRIGAGETVFYNNDIDNAPTNWDAVYVKGTISSGGAYANILTWS